MNVLFILYWQLQGRAQMVATYALCGFSNIGSIGIQIACLTGMCPEQKQIYPKIAVRALIAGSVSCFITASFAGKKNKYTYLAMFSKA